MNDILGLSIGAFFATLLVAGLIAAYTLDSRRLDIMEANGCVAHMVE